MSCSLIIHSSINPMPFQVTIPICTEGHRFTSVSPLRTRPMSLMIRSLKNSDIGNAPAKWLSSNLCSSCGRNKVTKSYSSPSLARCSRSLRSSSSKSDTATPNWTDQRRSDLDKGSSISSTGATTSSFSSWPQKSEVWESILQGLTGMQF